MHIYTDEIERLRGSIVTRDGKKKIAVVSGDRSLNGFVVLSRQWREGIALDLVVWTRKEGNVIIVERIN